MEKRPPFQNPMTAQTPYVSKYKSSNFPYNYCTLERHRFSVLWSVSAPPLFSITNAQKKKFLIFEIPSALRCFSKFHCFLMVDLKFLLISFCKITIRKMIYLNYNFDHVATYLSSI